ncbi:hypothetical protein HWV62_27245 [Athelia sp. TMB]|nr:hypothetical protein HWV62_27245 [Athelia sp. TMB]
MGVPALFRWLSKKYPKIICPVVEGEGLEIRDDEGDTVKVPVNMADRNPNGTEFDNLYLDMNGIPHPETEEEMMLEIFNYTERVVNMVRPRKLLFMAIDGVAPRAKMNEQRSRRFRSAQDAKEKGEARKEAEALWEGMGKEITDDQKSKKAWDTNAITPGTPFMDFLARSLRYWVAKKMSSDPGWKAMQVIISDANVPGEGEHKIMDFIRRQRANPGHDPNTRHVFYGLDADLIMLALATHEPNFRVLREDVFDMSKSATACRTCGQEGHYAAQCTGPLLTKEEKKPEEKKPFIFLDVTVLREYLEVELHVPDTPFTPNFEQSIDDWVLLIFLVGNDFLPHLPSLEIREGAIDTLLKIWKEELSSMGGYLTNHGQLELARTQIILDRVAQRETDIFRKRREAEERQDQNTKRRKIEEGQRISSQMISVSGSGPSPMLSLGTPTSALSHHPLPPRPSLVLNSDSIGFGAKPTVRSVLNASAATLALAGSNRDVVANRAAIRMAHMSAAEILKAEMAGHHSLKPSASPPSKPLFPADITMTSADDLPGLPVSDDTEDVIMTAAAQESDAPQAESDFRRDSNDTTHALQVIGDNTSEVDSFLAGVKRRIEEVETEIIDDCLGTEEENPNDTTSTSNSKVLKINPDGTVDQDDTVKLWEPGYRERYYRQKFGVELADVEFRKRVTKHYVEGMAWVLHYYYQGTPSWQWFYPYHFAPFAADFENIDKMEIRFELGQPVRPFEQLMSVFPAASRFHIPSVFHHLMTDENSPIIDFYPTSFEIDMNGKKMPWQGVVLMDFINPKRLLDAMAIDYPKLTEEEKRRNRYGNYVLSVSDEHPLYQTFETLYGKRKHQEPVPLDVNASKGISGSVLPNEDCIPRSTYSSPLSTQADIKNNKTLTATYLFPKQLSPHRSILLPGVKRPVRYLTSADRNAIQRYGERNGSDGRGRGGYDQRGGRGSGRGGSMLHSNFNPGLSSRERDGLRNHHPQQRPPQASQGYGGYTGSRQPRSHGEAYGNVAPRGGPSNSAYHSRGSRGSAFRPHDEGSLPTYGAQNGRAGNGGGRGGYRGYVGPLGPPAAQYGSYDNPYSGGRG